MAIHLEESWGSHPTIVIKHNNEKERQLTFAVKKRKRGEETRKNNSYLNSISG